MPTVSTVLIALVTSAATALASATAAAERLHFDSAARTTDNALIFQGRTAYTDHIHGELQLPSQGAAPFPAVVIMHSSRGIGSTIREWARLFNDMGIATFVVDSFGPRGLQETTADRLDLSVGVVDSLRALQALQQDRRIDSKRIGAIGFSRGAIAVMGASFERYRHSVLGHDAGAKFAWHIVFYGGCAQYARTTGSPILTFLGTEDDFTHVSVCRKDAEILNQQGTKTELVVYDGALHGFDTDYPYQWMPAYPNFKNCRMLLNLDTFDAILADGRALSAGERADYYKTCSSPGSARGGNPKYAAAARERVKLFVDEQLKLPR